MPADLVQSFRIDPADLPSDEIIFGGTPAMQEVHGTIHRVLDHDLPILIRGESGTGKEVVARFLHARSNRRDGAFVRVNCATIPATLLESKLLGYQRGALARASDAKQGFVEMAAGGTLFLDEIGNMEWALQTKLLHLLQDGQYARIGGREERQARMRVICATNRNLEEAVERRMFRQDLFYRIDVINMNLPPLRERKTDIPRLCQHFIEKLAEKFGRSAPLLTPATLELLEQWDWPGNLRELENWIARFIVLGGEQALGAEFSRQLVRAHTRRGAHFRKMNLKETSRQAASETTRAVILKTLQANRWNRRKTAEDLNMSYRSLLYMLRDAGKPPRRGNHHAFPPIE